MHFGLTNAPATFQRLMESCLGGPTDVSHLLGVFEKLSQAELKFKPSKCTFFQIRISYLGHVVSEKGIENDPKKIAAIIDWLQPKTVTDVISFLAFTNYY